MSEPATLPMPETLPQEEQKVRRQPPYDDVRYLSHI